MRRTSSEQTMPKPKSDRTRETEQELEREFVPGSTGDPGSEFLLQSAHPSRLAKKKGPQVKRLVPYLKFIGCEVYFKTDDGWYTVVTVRDVKWSFGRIDFLAEQGDMVRWVSAEKCFLPPGWQQTIPVSQSVPTTKVN